VVCHMSDSYSIVLWCADIARFASMVGSHLLSEGILAANRGRIDDEIPILVGVANARRWPVFSREVAARGVVRCPSPRVSTVERVDYLLTFNSESYVDSTNAPDTATKVIDAAQLVQALENTEPSTMSKQQVLELFASVAEPATVSRQVTKDQIDVQRIADMCQRLVMLLAR